MEDQPPKSPQISEKRQKILDKAFDVMRKARGQMDPQIINKIRRMVASSPEIMKKLGVEDDLKPKAEEKRPAQPVKKETQTEAIDQAKNMEVMAKLLALNPQSKDQIIKTIKKARD